MLYMVHLSGPKVRLCPGKASSIRGVISRELQYSMFHHFHQLQPLPVPFNPPMIMSSSQCRLEDASRELQEDEIRLLRFLPSPQNSSPPTDSNDVDDIHLEMQIYKRSSAPRYLALSYVWGAQGSERTIMLNEEPVKIRVNLHAALKYLRSHMGCRNLWPSRSRLRRADWLYSEEGPYNFEIHLTGRREQALRLWLLSVQQRQDPWITHRLETALATKLPSLRAFGVKIPSPTRVERDWARELQKQFIALYSDPERSSLALDVDSPNHGDIACAIADHYMLDYSVQSSSIRFSKQEYSEDSQLSSPLRIREELRSQLTGNTHRYEASPEIMDYIFDSDPYLRYVAEHFGSPYLWVDAVCIDQQNIHERNRQVKVMDQIFRDALSVVAWLGELEPSGSLDLNSYRKYLLIPKTPWENLRRDGKAENSVPVTGSDWASLGEGLACSTLFTRMWCAQE